MTQAGIIHVYIDMYYIRAVIHPNIIILCIYTVHTYRLQSIIPLISSMSTQGQNNRSEWHEVSSKELCLYKQLNMNMYLYWHHDCTWTAATYICVCVQNEFKAWKTKLSEYQLREWSLPSPPFANIPVIVFAAGHLWAPEHSSQEWGELSAVD